MDLSQEKNLNRTSIRLAQYQQHIESAPPSRTTSDHHPQPPTMAARDPITCHVLNTLTGTPASNLPVTLTLLSGSTSTTSPISFTATTNADGRVSKWTPAAGPSASVPELLGALPAADTKTNWAVRFETGPWYEAQGIESFWPEVEVKFIVKGRGREGEGGWRHYHVPVLLGPWNYSTYRGS